MKPNGGKRISFFGISTSKLQGTRKTSRNGSCFTLLFVTLYYRVANCPYPPPPPPPPPIYDSLPYSLPTPLLSPTPTPAYYILVVFVKYCYLHRVFDDLGANSTIRTRIKVRKKHQLPRIPLSRHLATRVFFA